MPRPSSVPSPFLAEVAIGRRFALAALCGIPPRSPRGTGRRTYRRPEHRIDLGNPQSFPISATGPAQTAASFQRRGGVIVNGITPHHEPFLSRLKTWPLTMAASLSRNGSSHESRHV